MLGLRASVGSIGLTLFQNLSHHGIRAQGIRIGSVEIPSKKPLGIALQYIYGIGPSKSRQILCELGMSSKRLAADLTGKEVMSIREEIGRHEIGEDVRRRVNSEVQRLITIQCYRGIRHTHGLPCRGQRTKTNARTIKGRHPALPGKKKAPRK